MDTKEMQRWTTVAAGTLLAAAGVKRGGRNGLLLSLAGSAVAAFGLLRRQSTQSVIAAPRKSGSWQPPHDRLMDDAKAFGRTGRPVKDVVHEASEESFPASDPPSFTATTSVGKHERR